MRKAITWLAVAAEGASLAATKGTLKLVAGLLMAATCCVLAPAMAIAAPTADPLASPVDQGQASEALTNRFYENSTPLVRDSDNATKRSKTSAPENSDDLPDDYAFNDADKPGNEFM